MFSAFAKKSWEQKITWGFKIQYYIHNTQARCDEAGEEHQDGSNVGFVSI